MGKDILTFEDIEIENNKFYHHMAPIFLKDVEIEKVLVSNKISFGEKNYKYFIGYLYNDNKVRPLHIMLSKTSVYVKCYDGQTKWMYFLIEDDDLLKKYSTISDKVSADIKKEFELFSLDSALKTDNNYYLQVFLKKCKYIEKKVIRHIIDNLSDFSSSDESDEE